MQWVGSNRNLIHSIAAPYLRHMAADSDDLFQEATVAAFMTLITTRKKQMSQRFAPFFRIIFKTHCLKLATGIPTTILNDSILHPCEQEEDEERFPEPFQIEIEEALQAVGEREREVCTWILEQTKPVTASQIAQHFRVSHRHACRLVHNAVEQITKAA